MIEISLIEDKSHYHKEQLGIMRGAFIRNFMLSQKPELETRFKPSSPEMLIHIRLLQGLLPEILFRALGEDLCNSISGGFLNAFVSPNSEQAPSLIFQFVGDFRSFEFKITSRDEKTLEEASEKVIEKLLDVVTAEEFLPESNDLQTFHYENENWIEVR
jgi:hypothetical protein